MSTIKRRLVTIDKPQAHPGFMGAGHTARAVINGGFQHSDPFILLMDDMLDKKDNIPVGGAHPHGGFETVSLLLEGEMGDEAHKMQSGDFQLMTSGSGIVHTETIDKAATMRLLQLWVDLPKKDRYTTPRVQDLSLKNVPAYAKDGVAIRLYSGKLAGLSSPIINHVPMIIADISVDAATTTTLQIPANYNTFVYVLNGSMLLGADEQPIQQHQTGWLNLTDDDSASELQITTGNEAVRFVLYAGKPVNEPIVSHGPFIADTVEEIQSFYRDYRLGKMQHIATVPENQRIMHG